MTPFGRTAKSSFEKAKQRRISLGRKLRANNLNLLHWKLFERILEHRLRQHLDINGLIDDSQEGFRKKRGSGRYIYQLIENLQNVKHNNKTAAALFIDLEKAFDSIWIDGTLFKLRIALIRGTIYNVIDDFVRNRYITISLGTIDSHPFKPRVGLPQGSILSPILILTLQTDI